MKNFWMAILVAFTAVFFNTGCAQKSIFRDSPLLVKGFVGLGFGVNNPHNEYFRVLINKSDGDPHVGDIGPHQTLVFDAGWGWNYTPQGNGYKAFVTFQKIRPDGMIYGVSKPQRIQMGPGDIPVINVPNFK